MYCDKIIYGTRPYGLEAEPTEFIKNLIIKEFTIKVSQDWQELLNHYWGEHWSII